MYLVLILFLSLSLSLALSLSVSFARTVQASSLKAQINKLRLNNLRFEKFKPVLFEIADPCPAKLQVAFSPEDVATTLVQKEG